MTANSPSEVDAIARLLMDMMKQDLAVEDTPLGLGYPYWIPRARWFLEQAAARGLTLSAGPEAVIERHRRHVEQSPGIGEDVQRYTLAVCDAILADLRAAPQPAPAKIVGEPMLNETEISEREAEFPDV